MTTIMAELEHWGLFINGQFEEGENGSFPTTDPYRGSAWASVAAAGPADVDRAVAAARGALVGPWGAMTGAERGVCMRRLADLVRRDADELARIETRDNGKLLREMAGQVALLPQYLEYYAGWADKIHGEVVPTEKPNFLVYTVEEPIGVVAAITAWNSPLLLLHFKLAPALAAGCTFIVKPAEQTSVSTLKFAALATEAGFPDGVLNVVCGDGPVVGGGLARHPGVDKVSFTGSTATGISVAHDAAEHLAPVSLELGGKSSNVIFDDADIEAAVNGVVAGVFAASGQTCQAGSRVVVHERAVDEVAALLVERAEAIRLGDPADPLTEMGPLAFREQHQKVLDYIRLGVDDGGTVLAGGGSPDGELADGMFITPTLFRGLPSDARLNQEEIFGPVASIIPFSTEEEAVALANDVSYGLAAGIWTRDVQRAHRVARQVHAGTVWINAYRVISPSVPFGGFKSSGYGREGGRRGIDEFLETNSIWVELSGSTRDPFKLG
jgi:(Z)-2-((N-methylformamido)methylene)-5-hydroxybutyrolactone dehydrogenase